MFKRQVIKRVSCIIVLVLAVALFFAFDCHELLTFERLKASQTEFAALFSEHSVQVVMGYLAVYIPCIALNLPGAAILGLAAGVMFGTGLGTIIVSFASTVGATLAFLISRYLLRDWVQATFGDRLESVDRGIANEGHFYLFSLRLIPVIPFCVINMVMGLTRIPLRTFLWVSMLGMLPGTFVFVNAGSQIASLDSVSGIISPSLLFSFALLGILPLVAKRVLHHYRTSVGV